MLYGRVADSSKRTLQIKPYDCSPGHYPAKPFSNDSDLESICRKMPGVSQKGMSERHKAVRRQDFLWG